MTPFHLRRLGLALVILWAAAAVPARVAACPFCGATGQTLTEEAKLARLVVFGTLANPKADPDNLGDGSTDLVIEAVLEKDPVLGDKKSLVIPRFLNPDKDYKYLVFCDVFQGKVDPTRIIPVKADSDIVKYLGGALTLKDKDVPARLRFFFDFLPNADVEISNDAFREFGNADYKDFRAMVKGLPADRIAGWLQDPNTPSFRYGLYASMLGHCGNGKHAAVLRGMVDDPKKRLTSGVDGVLAGYAMLSPSEGWAAIRSFLADSEKEFLLRYAALRAVRFFWDYRPDVIAKKDLLDGLCLLLDQNDISDLAIEDLRQRGCWEVAGRVVGLYGKKSHDVPIIRRAILHYALSCPNEPAAAALVNDLRKKDPDLVKDAEELLKLQAIKPPAPAAAQK